MAHVLKGGTGWSPVPGTMIGAMSYYITHADPDHFQPMNANFGIMHKYANVKKKDRKAAYAPQSLALIRQMKESHVL